MLDQPTPSFAELGVGDDLVSILDRAGIREPFEIQQVTIPDAMAGHDILGRAPTGSGKTLAFGISMVCKLKAAEPRRPTGLILSPTRELAEQIRRELQPLAASRQIRTLAVYGGVGFGPQLKALASGVELLVACPGRLQDLVDKGEVSLDAVRIVVVDEADRMADMGFLPDVRALLDLTNARRQTMLFSATLGKEVRVLTDQYQHDPVFHAVGDTEPDLALVTHRFIRTDRDSKIPLGAHIINEAGYTIVFCRTRYGVDRVAGQLKAAGIKTSLIHGKRTQNQRDNALAAFTKGKVAALVATDVAARGIHVDGVACVLHFDPPDDSDAYIHRSGRTARAGAGGAVVSFINGDQIRDCREIQRALGLPTEIEDAPTPALRPRRKPSHDDAGSGPDRSRSTKRSGSRPNKGSGRKRAQAGARPKPKSKQKSRTRTTGSDTRSTSRGQSRRSKPGSRAKGKGQRSGGTRGRSGGSSRGRSSDRSSRRR